MKKKGSVENTLKGTRKGSRWPPQVKIACLCELMILDNVHNVAKRNGVPESTLRSWAKEAKKLAPGKKRSLWDEARATQIEEIAYRAASGARLTSEMINRRLEIGDENSKRVQEIRTLLLSEQDPEKIAELEKEMKLRPELADYPMANFMRVLMNVSERAGCTAEGDTPQVVNVVLEEGAEKYAK